MPTPASPPSSLLSLRVVNFSTYDIQGWAAYHSGSLRHDAVPAQGFGLDRPPFGVRDHPFGAPSFNLSGLSLYEPRPSVAGLERSINRCTSIGELRACGPLAAKEAVHQLVDHVVNCKHAHYGSLQFLNWTKQWNHLSTDSSEETSIRVPRFEYFGTHHVRICNVVIEMLQSHLLHFDTAIPSLYQKVASLEGELTWSHLDALVQDLITNHVLVKALGQAAAGTLGINERERMGINRGINYSAMHLLSLWPNYCLKAMQLCDQEFLAESASFYQRIAELSLPEVAPWTQDQPMDHLVCSRDVLLESAHSASDLYGIT
ncbi:uncharacterized protein LAESUDRAFT_718473 [Laetiporus sulphureus 93-53]|uniref:Uncharacterized protein n=1 Tax=Laetiporus sulphureus 93-53 TaxID=1314785 RepID=A0A165AXB5_9APHY|nr:uncharacterized protein LAESUDRAFT_718473 [Laetiporus sulphureus 93-53]KZS99833.1 hypothetical protein LAESUDRAFT_718473 [Laetiporus sulphureus 93-53]